MDSLPIGWTAREMLSQELGNEWLDKITEAVLIVPSVIMPISRRCPGHFVDRTQELFQALHPLLDPRSPSMEFAAFVVENSQDSVLVNPLLVRCVRRVEGGSRIEFDEYHHIVVAADLSTVAKALELPELTARGFERRVVPERD
jgi:hypothetical protein